MSQDFTLAVVAGLPISTSLPQTKEFSRTTFIVVSDEISGHMRGVMSNVV